MKFLFEKKNVLLSVSALAVAGLLAQQPSTMKA